MIELTKEQETELVALRLQGMVFEHIAYYRSAIEGDKGPPTEIVDVFFFLPVGDSVYDSVEVRDYTSAVTVKGAISKAKKFLRNNAI